MSALYPTLSRKQLLRAIERGEVTSSLHSDDIRDYGGYRVTERVKEMWREGWCEPVVGSVCERWSLTDAGRDVLAGGAPC